MWIVNQSYGERCGEGAMTGTDADTVRQLGDKPPSPQPSPEAKPPAADTLSAAQLRQELDALKAEMAARIKAISLANPPPPQTGWQWFFSSGIFFICLGIVLLIAAYIGLAIGVHTSFSFVLVVLGVAILLFGTGTQGMGKLESDTAAAKYNVALAGGAGALALAIGFGMIEYGPQMQRAFDVETRYVIAMLHPNPDGSSSFNDYWAEFDIDGVSIPSVRRGDTLLAFVPYFDTQKDATKHVSYRLRPQDPRTVNASFKTTVLDKFDVPLAKVNRNNSGFDFPVYDNTPPVDMRSNAGVSAALKAAADQKLPNAPGATAPNPTTSAVLEAQ
jgi:hypothetical protein